MPLAATNNDKRHGASYLYASYARSRCETQSSRELRRDYITYLRGGGMNSCRFLRLYVRHPSREFMYSLICFADRGTFSLNQKVIDRMSRFVTHARETAGIRSSAC
jgi:hypothetical protein